MCHYTKYGCSTSKHVRISTRSKKFDTLGPHPLRWDGWPRSTPSLYGLLVKFDHCWSRYKHIYEDIPRKLDPSHPAFHGHRSFWYLWSPNIHKKTRKNWLISSVISETDAFKGTWHFLDRQFLDRHSNPNPDPNPNPNPIPNPVQELTVQELTWYHLRRPTEVWFSGFFCERMIFLWF